jgi:HK97 family phage portal protein
VQIFGLTILRTKALADQLQSVDSRRSAWWPVIRESFAGAWQTNTEVTTANVMTFSAVYACVTLQASDIGKLRPKLVQQDENGIWTDAESSAYSPVLRKPNHYQTRIQFLENWTIARLMHGNTYILKERDSRGVVVAMYPLDPSRCTPMVAESGDVYYELKTDSLSGLKTDGILVPASEIIHDRINALYHPLVGISPITACGLAAVQGLRIQDNSAVFFGNGSQPGGVLTAPNHIADATAARLKAYWDENFTGSNIGKVAVLGDGLKYEQMTMSATDSQLIEQLKWTAENVCTAFKVPPYKIGVGPTPAHNSVEALDLQYYTQTLQSPIESIELLLDEGLGILNGPQKYGVELEVEDGLMRMDTTSRVTAAKESLAAGMTVNEVRRKFFGFGPVTGGNTVYLQQQNYSLEALAKRDASPDPFGNAPAPTPPQEEPPPADDAAKSLEALVMAKAFEIAERNSRAA